MSHTMVAFQFLIDVSYIGWIFIKIKIPDGNFVVIKKKKHELIRKICNSVQKFILLLWILGLIIYTAITLTYPLTTEANWITYTIPIILDCIIQSISSWKPTKVVRCKTVYGFRDLFSCLYKFLGKSSMGADYCWNSLRSSQEARKKSEKNKQKQYLDRC